ncbi:MAG TPA: NYN domain-containing protein [Chloroflexota bacterium]|nr:NYN domain-containing protein [Chloroflexota bacterium]
MATDRTERRGAGASAPGSVALFIDWDNFAIGLRQEMPDRPADVGPILRWARRFGVLSVVRAYGEWRDPSERLAIYNAGVEVVYAPVLPLGGSVQARAGAGGAKSLADTAMAVDVTDALNLMPSITTVILATSDKDLIPVLRFAQRRGLHAVVVGSDRTAGALRDLADEFISYRQLLDSEVPTGTQSRPVMVPPVRYPRAGGRSEGVRALPPPERGRSGRFESRSVVVPVDRPAPASAIGAPLAAPIGASGIAEPNPAASSVGTPGSVFADGEDQPGSDAAARRRRRGGRRRRGREVTGEGGVAAEGADVDVDEDEEGAEPTPDAVMVGAGDLAAHGEVAAEAAANQPEAEPTPEPPRLEPIVQRRPEPAANRAPVVLPGERLRRLAPQPPPDPEPAPPEEEPAAEAEPSAESAPTRARGRRGGRTRATAAAADEPTAEAPEPEGEDSATEDAAEGASATKTTRPAARGRRRGGRTR